MLGLKQQKHLFYFDQQKQSFSSFLFTIKQKQDVSAKNKQKQPSNFNISLNEQNIIINNLLNSIQLNDIIKQEVTFRIKNQFTYKWQSDIYDLKIQQAWNTSAKLHKIPLSLETYFAMYKNPYDWKVSLVLKPKYTDSKYSQKEIITKIYHQGVGKLIITSNFSHIKDHEPFCPSVLILNSKDINLQAKKTIKIITLKDHQNVICSGKLVTLQNCSKVGNFILSKQLNKEQVIFKIYTYEINERVNTQNICIFKHKFKELQFQFNNVIFKIMSPADEQPVFIPILAKILQHLRSLLELQPLIIIQNVQTDIQDSHGIVFYSDLLTLSNRIFKSYLYDKIEDKWMIEGMINYTRSNKNFQDCMSELIELMTDGQEFFPLNNDQYCFDDVWKAKAKFFFYVMSNFKTTRDSGSSSLVGLILDYSKKKKIYSTYLFRRLKKKYGLDGAFRSTYQEQFIKCTGLNRIFYELIDIRRDNSVKYIVRQKSLLNKFFKTYNLYRIKLQQTYGMVSPMMQKIMKKNRYDDQGKKKDLLGALAVPEFLKCLPYFKGKMTVESDACEPFQLQMIEQNIIQKTKQSSSLRTRPMARKPGEVDKGTDGFNWMMLDTAYVFPAVYKNQNIHENVILQKIKKTYESEQEQIKVLNCISSRDHSQNQQICHALLDKLKMKKNTYNTTLSVKRKILQIIPIFINTLKDPTIWQDYYQLFVLYEPPCYDHSQDGFQFLLSLIESSTNLNYKKEYSYYFNQLHRILLSILANHQLNSQEKQLKLKNLLYKSLLRWKSKYSFEILKFIKDQMQIYSLNVRNNLFLLKILVKSLLEFLDQMKNNIVNHVKSNIQLIENIKGLIQNCIQNDKSGQIYSIKFQHNLINQQKKLKSIDFLRSAFGKLEELEKSNNPSYWLCLKKFKNVLNQNTQKYGLSIQLDELNEDQSYFLAQYLWIRLQLKSTLTSPKIRLQWLKIYRIFYFYYTPIISVVKLSKHLQYPNLGQFSLSEQQTQKLLQNVAQISFIPQLRWLSGYDSSSSKQQKAKYQQYNLQNNRRKRKFQELSFEENNIITRYIMDNPGKDSWEDIAREALKIIITIVQKKQVDNPQQADKYKKIVQGLKNVQNYLKRGNMPNDFTFEKLRIQSLYVLRQYDEDTEQPQEIFQMVQRALESIRQQKRQRDIEKQNQMKIFIPKDFMSSGGDLKLQAIEQHPEQQFEEQEKYYKEQENQRNQEDHQNLQVDHRYSSIFDE